ncbi:MAG: NAD(+) diphosphatase [Sphingobium sp.]
MNEPVPLSPGFCVSALDRCDAARSDPAVLDRWFAGPDALRIRLDGLDPVLEGHALAREPVPAGARTTAHILLGKNGDGRPLFVELQSGLPHGGQFAPRVWQASDILDPAELGLYAAARSLLDWHARHNFCAQCGAPTEPAKGGWSRMCGGCGAEHFPRVDPVVIMLAEYEGRVLLGRQGRFPPRRYSALAGFIEPGETMEAAVARELHEEAGVRAFDIRYVMSQPWPFPSSLMIACTAKAESDVLQIDERELEDAMWVDAGGIAAALRGDPDAPFVAPPPMAVAHHLLRHWLDAAG